MNQTTTKCIKCQKTTSYFKSVPIFLERSPSPNITESFILLNPEQEDYEEKSISIEGVLNNENIIINEELGCLNNSLMDPKEMKQLCVPCSEKLKIIIDEEEEELLKELEKQQELMNLLNNEEQNQCEKSKNNSKEEEKKILSEIETLQKKNDFLELSLKKLTSKSFEIEKQKKNFWNFHFQNFENTQNLLESKNSTEFKNGYYEFLLKKESQSIINKLFYIWHDGDYGTINGLRFGRHVEPYVEWDEFNSAYSHVVLLVDILAKKFKYAFSKYQFIHLGSESKILNLLTSSKEDLFMKSTMYVSNFNAGISAFLSCLDELCQFVQKKIVNFKLHYP
eukprot:gene10648-3272_t